jgi:signal transduction histidine kinase
LKFDWRSSRVLTRVSGPGIFDWRLFWWSYALAFIPQIGFDVIGYDSPSWLWLPIWTAGHLLAALVAFIFRVTFLDRMLARRPNPWVNILVAMVLGITKVTFIGYLSFVLELQNLFDPLARVIAGSISGVITAVFLINVLQSSREYNQTLRELIQARNRLDRSRKEAKRTLKASQHEIEVTTRKLLEPRLLELENLLRGENIDPAERQRISKEIHQLLEEQVRPLSRNLRESSRTLADDRNFRKLSRLTLFRLPAQAEPHLAYKPMVLFALFAILIPFALYVFADDSWLTLGFLIALVNLGILSFFKLILNSIRTIPTPAAIVLLLFMTFIPAAVDYLLLLHADFPRESILGVLLTVFISAFFAQLGVGLVVTQEYNRENFLKQLASNNERIERELALLNQKMWVEKRNWALRIHGTVQASLTAAHSRLSKPGEFSSDELAKVREHLLQARKGLAPQPHTGFDLKKSLTDIRKSWSGITSVKSNLQGQAAKILMADRWAGVCANEIIKEAVSNSIRHGSSSEVKISCEQERLGFVTIVVRDNGKGPSTKASPGLGSQLLDEVSFPWSLSREGQQTVLRAQIPVSRKRLKS